MNFYASESDFIVGKVGKLRRYLMCAMEGYFPVMAKTGPNSLAVIYRTGGTHIGTSATVAVSFSDNGGVSWSDPKEIAPRWQDARNPAFGVNGKGHIIAAYWKALKSYKEEHLKQGHTVWREMDSVNIDNFYQISRDGGATWSGEIPLKLNVDDMALYCPYGRIISDADGVMYMCVYGVKKNNDNVTFLMRSYDGGETWGDESGFPMNFNETSYVFTKNGTMIAAARHLDSALYVARSTDKGRTWSEPERVTRPGEHPADIIELASGKILMTYGRRIRPMGCGALVSYDDGVTWDHDHEILLAGDGIQNGDLGYPSTVQLDDGSINTALYYASGSEPAHQNWGDISCQLIKYTEHDIIG